MIVARVLRLPHPRPVGGKGYTGRVVPIQIFFFIVDCLDNGNNKKALQEAEKVLKKQKDFLCAKVLFQQHCT